VILRQVAPPDTIGGGLVVDPTARKHGSRPEVVERLAAIERGEVPEVEEPEAAAAQPDPEPLDDAALALASLLRADGAAPRTDTELGEAAGLSAADTVERLRRLERAGQAARVARNLHFHPEPLAELEARVVDLIERDGRATIASVRDTLGTSRKYAQALLEHLDAQKVTIRRGDEHVLRRRSAI
jgi:selenocysteine-specific elongation factor